MSFWQRVGLINLVIGAALLAAALSNGAEGATTAALLQIACGIVGFLISPSAKLRHE